MLIFTSLDLENFIQLVLLAIPSKDNTQEGLCIQFLKLNKFLLSSSCWKLFEAGGVVTFVAEDVLLLWLVFWVGEVNFRFNGLCFAGCAYRIPK
jgi:hypothetical protein